jgi:outer membrane protein assembly factor BamE (lipoprotein component of BamABCDE complex)
MRRTASLVLASALYTIGGCATYVDNRGFSPAPGAVEKVEVGSQSREDVVRLIGSPTAVSTFDPNIWYYINQRQEQFAFLKPTLTQQSIMQVTFADTGRVKDLKYYDLKDAKDVEMVSRVTPTAGKELTVIEQIMGNVGRFSGPKQQGNPGAPTGAPTGGSL